MANKKLQQDILKKARDRIAGKTTQTVSNARQSVLQKAQNITQNRVMVEQPQMDATRQRALDLVRDNIRRRQEDANFKDNLANSKRYFQKATTAAAPGAEKLQRGLYEETLKKIGGQIENEQNIISKQNRAEDDPARIRAQEELENLTTRQAETMENLAALGTQEKQSMKGYTPEEEAYIRRIQQKIEKGQSRYQPIGYAYTPEVNSLRHMRNTPKSKDDENYVRWLQEGEQLGLFDKATLNAMMSQAGDTKPYEQYKGLDDKYKSSWGDYKNNAELMRIYGLQSAWDYGENYDYNKDKNVLLEQKKYFSGELDKAQALLDEEMLADTPERRERINRYQMLAGEIPLPETWKEIRDENGAVIGTEEPTEEFLSIIRTGKKPADYDARESDYDAMMYDFIYGQGAWNRDFINGTDEESDKAFDRVEELWDRFEKGTVGELAEKNRVTEYQSQVGYYGDQLSDVNKKLNPLLKIDELMSQYEGIDGADYDPELDRGRTTLWTYDDEYYDPNTPYATPYTNDVHRIYSFINKGNEYQAYLDFVAGGNVDTAKVSEAYGKTALMNKEQKRIFNDLYKQGRYEEASAFLEGMSQYLNSMYSEYEHIYTEEMARQMPVSSSAASLGAELLSGPVGVVRTAAGLLGDKSVEDPYSEWYRTTRYNQQTQQAVADMIGGPGGDIYLQGMNTLRNMMNVATISLLGVPQAAASTASLAMFATQIYQDSTFKYLSEGNDYTTSVGYALLDAALETAEEKLPYEAILSGGGNLFVSWLANSLSEALEEFTGATVGEEIKAHLIGGGRSEWVQRRDKIYNEGGYMDENGQWVQLDGMDSNAALAEAQKQALKEYGQQVIKNTAAGFIGGGMGATYGEIQNYFENRKTGIQVNSKEGGFNTLLEAARGMNENSATRKLAEELYAKQQKGKRISNYQTGKLAKTMYEESGQEIRDTIEGAMTRKVESELKEEGASDEYAEQAAPIIAQTVTTGRTPKKADIRVIAKEDAGLVLMESYMTGDRDAKESIKQAGGEAAMNAQQAVRDVLGEKPAKAKQGPATEGLREFAPIAKQSDLDSAEGPRHDNGLDAVVDGRIVSIKGRSGDNYTVIDENNEEHTVNKKDVQAADESMGLLMEYADRNRDIVDDEVFRELAVGLKNNQGMNLDDYLEQSTRAIINFRTGGTVRNSRLTAGTLNALKTVAQRQNDRWDEERIKKAGKQRKTTPGKGIVTYNGIQAGTDEWEAMAKKAGPILGGQLRLIGEIGVRLGNEIEIVEREVMPDAFGWEDPDTGKIFVNLAAENVKGQAGNRHILTVTAHELTHWLEQNSPEEYKALRDFVFSTLRKNGTNIANRVIERIDNFQGLMKRDMTVNEAMAEIVADACDQVLTNEQVAKQLEAESPNLYQKIKSFVKNFIETVRSYAGHIDTSKESWKMIKAGQETMDELARIWLGARQEALGRQEENPEAAEAQEGTDEMRMSTREYPSSFIKMLPGHTTGQKRVIGDYLRAVNNKILNAAIKYRDNKNAPDERINISGVTEKEVNDINNLVGIDVTGYEHQINRSFFNHVEKRHGPNGKADKTMSDLNDVARIDWILRNYDTIERVTLNSNPDEYQLASGYFDKNNKHMPVIKYSKQLDGTIYVAEAVGENKYKKLQIISAYISKNPANNSQSKAVTGAPHAGNSLGHNVQNVHPSPAKNSILQNNDTVKQYSTREAEDQGIKDLEKALAQPRVKFSMREPVEATKDGLVALHNLGEEQLMKVFRLGGFAMPSIAIIRAAMGHTAYGDISVLFGKETIDPKGSRYNKVYGGDAWTPTYPSIEYKLNNKKLNKIMQRIKDMLPDKFNGASVNLVDLYEQNLGQNINRQKGEPNIAKAIGSEAKKWLRIAYMENTGKEIKYPSKQKELDAHRSFDNEQVIHIANILGRDIAEEAMKEGDPWHWANQHPEIVEQIRTELNNKWRESMPEDSRLRRLELYNEKNYSTASAEYMLRAINKYYNDGLSETVDIDALDKTLKETIDEEDFNKWVNNLFSGVIEKSGIRNNKEYYTNSGNPRSWEQLHDEETLDNVVRIMRDQEDKGENAFFGQSAIMARGTKDFKSIDEIRKNKEQLQELSEEEYSELRQNIGAQFTELMDELYDRKERNMFIARDRVIEAIADAVNTNNKTAANISRTMKEWGYNLTQEQAQRIADLMEQISNLPTKYFEAKPKRAVTLDEIKRVILPATASQELFDAMNERGIPYDTYDGTDEDRLAKLNSVENVQFSTREMDSQYMQADRKGDIETMDALVKQAAKRNGFDTREFAYHGSDAFGFTVFDMDLSQDEIFVAYNPDMSATYTDKGVIKPISEAVDIAPEYKKMRKMPAEDLAEYAKTVIKKWNGGEVTDIQYVPEPGDFGLDEKYELKVNPIVPWYSDRVILRRFELYDRIKDIVNPNGEAEGIYKLYTRPGNQLKIDAKGSLWREIPFVMYGSPLITDDGWYQYEDSFDQEKYDTLGLHYPTALTREVAEKARAWGFDSVRIYNVHDDGSRNPSIERSWEDGGVAGDIAIFFNPNDVKSADTITYDEEGNVIPPSERFSDESNDLRFSMREPELEVNRWMMGLSESSLRTAQERMLWKQYKEVNGSWELTKRFIRELTEQMRKLEAKENKTAMDTFEIQKLQGQIEKWEEKRNEYEEQILKVTSDKGYAAIMYRERNKMENLLNGRTEDEVRQTIDAMQAELDTVEKEMAERNAKLKELSERENVKLIRNQLNSAGLRRIAAKLKNDLGSELQNKEIENRLALLALKMKQGKVDSTEIMELADMLVGSMKPAYDDYVLSELRGMTIGLNSSEQETLKNRGMNIRDLQRELTGTGIRVVAGGPNTIDKNWDELLVSFPTLDPAANPGDMLWGPDADHKGLMDLVEDAIRQQKAMGPDSDQVAAMVLEAASDLVPEILTDAKSMKLIRESMEFIAEINQSTEALDNMEDLFNRLRKKNANTKATLGKLENKIVDAIEYTNELAKQHDITAWKHERRVIIDQLKDKHTKEILEIQTKYREKIAKDKKARDLMGDNNALRREIHRNISKYRRLIVNETDRENVPEAYKPLAREMLMKLIRHDLAADRKITVIDEERLADAFHFLSGMNARDGKFGLEDLNMLPEDIREEVADALANIEDGIRQYDADPKGKDIIENLKTYKDGLEQVAEAVNLITNVINKARSISYMDRERRLDDEAARVIRDMRRIKKELAGRGSKSANAIKRSVFYGNMTPVYFFKNLKNAGISDQWEEFEAAENKNGLELTKAKAFFDKVAEECHYKSWDLDKEFTVKFNGFPVKITTEQIMALYATWQREKMIGPEESHHLETGGVILEDSGKDKGKPRMERKQQKARKVKDSDMAAILQLLTNEQKVYVHKVVGYLSKEMSDLGNEASMRMYGIKKYNEKWYFPFKVWDGVLSARSDKGITGKDENRAAHKGWSKRRKNNAGNALVIGNFTDTAVKHVVEMINYNTFAPAIENMNKIMNYQTVEVDQNQEEERRNIRVMFQEAYGTEALRYMEDWMRDLQGGVTQDQRKTLRDRLISMFKKNAVAGSLSVTLQQPLSYIRAAMMINPKYLAGALSPQYWKGSYQEMLDHSGVAVIKQMGRFDMNFGQSAQDWIMPKAKPNAYEKISDVLTAAPQAADTMTWTRMWSAVKMEQHAAHPDMDIQSEEFLDLVGKRFNEVMRRTQVYDSTLTKSSNMRSQALSMKLITSFMAEPTLSLNVLADAVANVKEKGGKATLAKAGATYLLSAVLQAAVKGFMGAGRSPDEKKTAAENVLNKIMYNLMSEANPASLIPGYSDLVEVLKNGELKDDALGVLGKLKSIYTTATNIMNPDKSKGPWRDVEDTLGQFVQLFSNIPLKNLMRDTRAMYNWATGSKFADRQTSGAVLKYQAQETRMNGDNLLGVINSWLGDAGYKSTNKAYYGRMYNAMAGGNQAEAEGIREYLELAKGQDESKISSGLRTAAKEDNSKTPAEQSQWMIDNGLLEGTSSITTQYKKGEITREDAEKLYKAADPKMKDNDVFWKLDQLDYQKETGETETGYYYRLRDAITKNKAEEIKTAVKTLLEHGITKEKIKDKLSDWKAEYLAGDSTKKIQIRDAITKAYKAAGYTAEDANKTIERWNKEAKKAEPEKKDANDTTGRWGRGNIDLNNRKVVENDDGTISTEHSFSVNIDGKEVLLPTVIDGKIVSEEEAIRHYEQTGQHLGKFNTVKEAEEYAEKLHNRQDWYYNQ